MAAVGYADKQSIREEAGLQNEILGEPLSGSVNGSNTDFYTNYKPLVDRDYDGDVDVSDVVLYVNGSAVSVAAINAATGLIRASVAPASGTVTADYAHSPVKDAYLTQVQEETENWIDRALGNYTTVPFTTSNIPKIVRQAARLYAAGILLIRDYGFNSNTEDWSKVGWSKIKLAKQLLTDYIGYYLAESTDGTSVTERDDGNLFAREDTTTGKLKPLTDENFTFAGDFEDDPDEWLGT